MQSLIEKLGALDLDEDVTFLTKQLQTLVVDRGEITELGEMFSKLRTTKALKAKWAAWNRQRKWCCACRAAGRLGRPQDHKEAQAKRAKAQTPPSEGQ